MKPDSYDELQYTWSVGRSQNVENGARCRVKVAVDEIRKVGMSGDNVLVIGPQHGFELLQFRDMGFGRVIGIDAVPAFCSDCRLLGFECILGEAERLSELVEGKWNIYASHSLEHCYDLAEAARQIELVCSQWCAIGVPIEPAGGSAGHCSPIRSENHLASLFPVEKWRTVFYEIRPSSKATGFGSVESIYAKI